MSSFIVTTRMLLVVLCAFFLFAISSSNSSPVPQQLGLKGNGRRIHTPFDGFGDTNIPCDRPGSFTQAPDGCNRCYCELDGKFSSVCSRALCPSSQGLFPSFGGGHRNIKF